MEARPLLTVNGSFTSQFGIEVDFKRKPMVSDTLNVSVPSGTAWDTSQWGSFYWSDDSFTSDSWVGVDGVGRAVSVRMEGSNNVTVSLNGFHIKYEAGGL